MTATKRILGVIACMIVMQASSSASAGSDELWLSSMPARQGEGHGGHIAKGKGGAGRPGSGQGHGGHESEHRPQPVRTYWLDTCGISGQAQAFLLGPEGRGEEVPVTKKEHEVSVTVQTPMGEGPAHGANNVYLVDRQVRNGVLVAQTAKWLTIHHNCGWGHDHRFNEQRQQPQALAQAPLEIVVDGLWDFNFHSNVMSGDTIRLQALSYGSPAAGARVTVVSEKGWSKTVTTDGEGRASFQLVRDYYPESWALFNRQQTGTMKLSASYSSPEQGEYLGRPYDRAEMTSTFSWRYYPARREYASYGYGLALAFAAMTVSGAGAYAYRERRKRPYKRVTLDE